MHTDAIYLRQSYFCFEFYIIYWTRYWMLKTFNIQTEDSSTREFMNLCRLATWESPYRYTCWNVELQTADERNLSSGWKVLRNKSKIQLPNINKQQLRREIVTFFDYAVIPSQALLFLLSHFFCVSFASHFLKIFDYWFRFQVSLFWIRKTIPTYLLPVRVYCQHDQVCTVTRSQIFNSFKDVRLVRF